MTAREVLARASRWIEGRWRQASNRLRMLRVEPSAWRADRARRPLYPRLAESELRDSLRSETCFIFGSGQSLDEITAKEWRAISQHNTIGFNYFIRARFVRVDFHVVGEMSSSDDLTPAVWRPVVEEYARLIEENPFYQQTVLGLQEGLAGLQSNRLAASGGIRPGRRVFRYRRIARGQLRPPSTSLSEGLVHGAGTLVDCVNLAVLGLLKDHPPDLVCSGINFGLNLGDDVTYSGTVSATFEGTLLGIPSLAFSQEVGEGFSFEPAARFARELAAQVLADETLPRDLLLNVNVPAGEVEGLSWTRLGRRTYQQSVIEKVDPRGRKYYWIAGTPEWKNETGTDYEAIASGKISITPLHLDLTYYPGLEAFGPLRERLSGLQSSKPSDPSS